jgi:hypothetical protein
MDMFQTAHVDSTVMLTFAKGASTSGTS